MATPLAGWIQSFPFVPRMPCFCGEASLSRCGCVLLKLAGLQSAERTSMDSLVDPARGGPATWARQVAAKPQPLSRAERIRRFGVDCGDGLEWVAGWEPGGEYTKQLVVKNVSTSVVKLKYKLPESKFFSMAFPETIKLTAGLSKTLQARAALPCLLPPAASACCSRVSPLL